jgi:hypothetical protein
MNVRNNCAREDGKTIGVLSERNGGFDKDFGCEEAEEYHNNNHFDDADE